VLGEEQSLKVKSGQRQMTIKPDDLEHYVGERGRRGAALPRGWRKVDRLE
jgi:topoisomerase-4 subunit A